ncbi:MAG: RNA polymerase sigma factor [Candidatus Eisenbacteria bacterium]|nr:RNA polymerase sigma factor [Candidatus Eisenbacteria bacterium]
MLTVIQAVLFMMIVGSIAGLQNVTRLATGVLMSHNQAQCVEELISIMTQSLDDLALPGLVTRAADGDERALEALYHRFKTPVFNLARRYTGNPAAAEDVLQDVFVTAFTRIGDVRDAARFPGWLFRVTVNTSLAHLRSSKVRGRAQIPIQEVESSLAAPGDLGSAVAARRPLEQAIEVLPPRLKSVFLLHDVEGFKHEEIADVLGCTVGTSKSNLFKARMKLRERLTELGMMPPAPVASPGPAEPAAPAASAVRGAPASPADPFQNCEGGES